MAQSPPYPAPTHPGPGPQPQMGGGTNGFAVASLVFGLVGGVPLAVIFGIVALVQIRRRGETGKHFAITGLVASAFWVFLLALIIVLSIVTGADRDSSGTVTGAGTVQVSSLKVGDCLNGLKEGSNVLDIPAVPCAQPHEGEVFATFTLTGNTWPGESAIVDQAEKGCADRLPGYAPKAADDEKLSLFYLHPTEQSWRQGSRTVTCIALDPAKRTGSIKG